MSHVIGLDLGKASIKYVTAAGPGDIPAWLARGHVAHVIKSGSGNGNSGLIIYKGQHYTVGRDATLANGFSWSSTEDKDDPRNLLFTLAVLGNLRMTDVDMVIGLPVSAAGSPAVVERVKGLLGGTHDVTVGGEHVSIAIRVGVLAEPLGTYFSLVLDQSGRPISSPYLDELIGIVDIGFRTVDVVILDGGKLATTRDSTLSGVTVLFDRACKLLEADHGKLRPNEVAKVHTWLVGGRQEPLIIAGKHVRMDLPTELARLKSELAGQIMDEVQSLTATIRPDRIIMTGGGALLLRGDLSRINPHLTYHQHPKMANAIGFYKSALARSRAHAES